MARALEATAAKAVPSVPGLLDVVVVGVTMRDSKWTLEYAGLDQGLQRRRLSAAPPAPTAMEAHFDVKFVLEDAGYVERGTRCCCCCYY